MIRCRRGDRVVAIGQNPATLYGFGEFRAREFAWGAVQSSMFKVQRFGPLGGKARKDEGARMKHEEQWSSVNGQEFNGSARIHRWDEARRHET